MTDGARLQTLREQRLAGDVNIGYNIGHGRTRQIGLIRPKRQMERIKKYSFSPCGPPTKESWYVRPHALYDTAANDLRARIFWGIYKHAPTAF